GFFIYFFIFNRLRIGIGEKNNLIRNTSSILLLLNMIQKNKSRQVVYAFVDAGCTNNAGLDKLLEQTNAKVYMLDSIGSDHHLYQVSSNTKMFKNIDGVTEIECNEINNNKLLYLLSAKKTDKNFFLPSDSLKADELNDDNMNKIMKFLDV